jgi:MYXO-CTERM domain-containing protein
MPAGTWEVVVGKAKVEEQPALYRVEIFLRDEATLRDQPRTPYQDPGVLNDESRWYAGDLHVHSRQSGDGRGSLEESLDYARDIAGLDFVMFSEHNTNSGLTYYGTIQPDYPNVLIIPGVEWTTYSGHANAIGATEWVDHKTGVRGVTAEGAIEAYHQQGALFYPTHPLEPDSRFCTKCTWLYDVDPATLDAVEVWSALLWDAVRFWEDVCSDGSHAVALGGSDDHDAGEGGITGTPIGTPTTMVYAENLSVEAILEGIRAGRTVVKVEGIDGPMLETELTGERVGDTVFADMSTLSVRVTGGEGLSLRVIKNGQQFGNRISIDSDPFFHELEVTAPAQGEDRYRHEVVLSGPKTIGSYVWLRAVEESPDGGTADGGSPDGGTDPSSSSGCNCRVVAPPDYDTALLLLLAAALGYLWRSRRRST